MIALQGATIALTAQQLELKPLAARPVSALLD
jgi:hypothetical protein